MLFRSRVLTYEKHSSSSLLIITILKIIKLLRKLKLFFFLFNFPDFDIIQKYRVYFKIRKLMRVDNYDMIIGVNKPFSNISALIKIKQKFPSIVCIGYYLDLIDSINRPPLMSPRVFTWLCEKSNIATFKSLDSSLVAKAGESLYKGNKKFQRVISKLDFVDFPTFQVSDDFSNLKVSEEKSSENYIKLMYAGTLDKKYRNPKYLLDLLSCITEFDITIYFDFYGIGNCNDILESYNSNSKLIISNNGYKDSLVIHESMKNADFLVNISNELNSSVPSKIFELFSTGKPIINVITYEDDITNAYFDRYPLVYTINRKKDLSFHIDTLYSFLSSENLVLQDMKMVIESFKENTPQFLVDIIESKFVKESW